jgi:hypothetical protein
MGRIGIASFQEARISARISRTNSDTLDLHNCKYMYKQRDGVNI